MWAGLLSGLCWLLGDILLVGFEVDRERYGSFVAGSQIGNQDMALLMLPGSVKRLRFGALIAHFSIPLMLASLYGLFRLAHEGFWSWLAVGILGLAFALSPLAHAAFYYVGIISKSAYERSAGGPCSEVDSRLINEAVFVLDITWRTAVGLTALGWLLYSCLIFTGQTALPVYFGLLTPLFGSPMALLIVEKLRIGRPYLNGAGLNIGLSLFYFLLLLHLAF
nr:DUF6796 family protein [Streptococcus panodentis]